MHEEWLQFHGAVESGDETQRISFAVPPPPAGRYTERLKIYDACGLTASLSASGEDDQQLRLLAAYTQEIVEEEAVGDLFCERADQGLEQPTAAPALRCESPQSEAPVQPAGSCLSLESASYQAPSVHDLVDVDADNARPRRLLLKTQSLRCDCLGKILVYRGHPTPQVSSERACVHHARDGHAGAFSLVSGYRRRLPTCAKMRSMQVT